MKYFYIGLACLVTLGGIFLTYFEYKKITQTQATAWKQISTADCAVVLTGGPYRVREGFDLLSQKLIKKLIVSGVHPSARLQDIFPTLPFYGEIKDEDIILERNSRTTYGNAQQTLQLVQALHCRDIVLVTSRIHMYRSLNTFRSVYPEEIPIYPHAIVAGRWNPHFSDILFETIKTLFYDSWSY